MKNSLLLSIVALLLVGLLVSCSSTSWISNPYSGYSSSDYVCATGRGKTMDEADLAARKELASLFGMAVQSTVSRTIVETSTEKNGNVSEGYGEFFTSTASVTVNADNLYGEEIAKRTVQKDGTCISLAVMDKKTTTDYYMARLKSDGEEIDALRTSITSSMGTMNAVRDAASLVTKSNDYNTSVVMCNYLSGSEIPFKSLADGYALHRQAREAVVLTVEVDGDNSGALKSAVSKVFTDAGFAVSNAAKNPTAKAVVSIVWRESAGTGVASSFIFAEYNADFSLVDLAGNESILVLSYKGKEGHQSFESAKSRAIADLTNKLEGDLRPVVKESFTY